MGNWSDPSWKMNVGINHTPAYQVSGRPYASGGIEAITDQQVINFPYVTRWVEVINDSSGSVKVGFGPFCFSDNNKNYFIVNSGSSSGRMELKVNRIYVSGGDDATIVPSGSPISVVAGLTSLLPNRVNSDSGATGISWSGSYDGIG